MLQNIKFHYTGRLTKYLSFLCLLFISLQSCDATDPNNDLPGRRDYTWTITGLLLAFLMYQWKKISADKLAERLKPLYKLSYNKWYFDEFYNQFLLQ